MTALTLPRAVLYTVMIVARERAEYHRRRADTRDYQPEPGKINIDRERATNLKLAGRRDRNANWGKER